VTVALPCYEFRTLMTADLPLVRRWLAQPHVAQWWGDADEQFDLVSADLNEPMMDQYIVLLAGAPLGYLQCYRPAGWNMAFGPQPTGTRGIDQFIGDADNIGCGHGSALTRAFCDALLAHGTPRIVTDPAPTNKRAIRAYEKAGFRPQHLVETPDGAALLMVRNA
jgi:aminoglycoside 6'-N-acetyltransferase